MRIGLITEGTYPTAHGGVSLWCDQLVHGLNEYDFDLHAIVASTSEPVIWQVPDNVVATTMHPLWGDPAARRVSHRDRQAFVPCFGALLDAMLRQDGAPATGGDDEAGIADFTAALQMMLPFARDHRLGALLSSARSVQMLLAQWSEHPAPGRPAGQPADVPAPSVADAVEALGLLEHFLRPLGTPAPRVDLTHAVSNGLACLVAFNAKWTNGIPFLLTEHGLYLRERYLEYQTSGYSFAVRGFLLRFFRLLTAAAYRMADFITPGSDYNRRWAIRQGAEEDRVRPVYNGVNPDEFPEGAEPEGPVLSWAGRIAPIKDVENLIRAFSLVRQEIPHARLRMFGSAPAGNEVYQARCRRLITELRLTEHARFEGRVDDIVDAYHAGQVVVLSSSSEGFPYTVIEAMTSGRATVSTDVGGVREAVADTGLVVPARDPHALAEACLQLLTDHDLRHRLASAARARALQNFTLEQFLSVYREVYPMLAAPAPVEPAHVVPGEPAEPAPLGQESTVERMSA